MRAKLRSVFWTILLWPVLTPAPSHGLAPTYQQAPPEVREILDAPRTPRVSLSPTRDRMLQGTGPKHPPIADLAQPMLALAGQRINPLTNGPHRPARYARFTLLTIADNAKIDVDVPDDANLSFPAWSPDGKRFAFANTLDDGIELWIGDAKTGRTRKVPGLSINSTYGSDFDWMPGSDSLICQAVLKDRRDAPVAVRTPAGPNIQESAGQSGPVRTYQDLLRTPHDADLFEYYATSQLVLVDAESLEQTEIGAAAVIAGLSPRADAY